MNEYHIDKESERKSRLEDLADKHYTNILSEFKKLKSNPEFLLEAIIEIDPDRLVLLVNSSPLLNKEIEKYIAGLASEKAFELAQEEYE